MVDPTLFRGEIVEALVGRVKQAGVAMTWYARMFPAAAGHVLRFQSEVGFESLLSVDDDLATVARVIGQSPALSVPACVLRGVARRVERLPADVATAVVSMYSWGRLNYTDHSFARMLGHDEVRIKNALVSAGLATVGRLQRCARVARVYAQLVEPGRPVSVCAEHGGFGTGRTLSAQVREFAGLAPRRAVRELNAEVFADRLVRAITVPAA